MAQQTPGDQLENINKLLAVYILSGNRKILTQVRSAVTILLRTNPTMSCRLKDTFKSHRLEITTIL